MPIEKPTNGQGYKPRTLQEIFRQMPEMEIPAGMAAARKKKPQTTTQDISKSIRILNQRADHPNSMRILDENNLRPLTYKEALAILTKNEGLKEQLKGKWFWIAGEGREINNLFRRGESNGLFTFDNQGNLTKGVGPSIEETVIVWKGNDDSPLSFGVHADTSARAGRRFFLYADNVPDDVAFVVVGVPK